jgi:hypothetical protein
VVLSDQADTNQIFIQCKDWSGEHRNIYYMDVAIGLGEYRPNIVWVVLSDQADTDYCMDGIVGLGGYQLNILWMLLSD